MKKLALIIITLSLVVITYFQYKGYQRFNPPSQYYYTVSDSIDLNYFDPAVLSQYYDHVYALGYFARTQWSAHGIDVLYPGDDPESQQASAHFTRKLGITKMLEDKLIYSRELKARGFDNTAIRYINEKGIAPENYYYFTNENFIGLGMGDVSQEVWEVQKILIGDGYDIPQDGTFGIETERALMDFQKKQGLFPSGATDEQTIKTLIKY